MWQLTAFTAAEHTIPINPSLLNNFKMTVIGVSLPVRKQQAYDYQILKSIGSDR
jgi:hypothetical protein